MTINNYLQEIQLSKKEFRTSLKMKESDGTLTNYVTTCDTKLHLSKRKRFARAPRGPLGGGPLVNSAPGKGYLSFQINILRICILENKK